jgi:hypothetical protein
LKVENGKFRNSPFSILHSQFICSLCAAYGSDSGDRTF